MSQHRITNIKLLAQTLRVKTAADEVENLQASAEILNATLESLRQQRPDLPFKRALTLAALEISRECFLQRRSQAKILAISSKLDEILI